MRQGGARRRGAVVRHVPPHRAEISRCRCCGGGEMILVVDDHPDMLRVIVMMLRRDGYEAAGVSSGRAALEHLQSHVPHCVILDYNMPGMDGLEVLAAIRAEPRYADVCVIL